MKNPLLPALLSCAAAFACCALAFSSRTAAQPTTPSLSAMGMQVDSFTTPIGVNSACPRFSWTLSACYPARRGLWQVAYQIQVAKSAAQFGAQNQVWDSRWVRSRQFWSIPYSGRPLASHETYYWRVRVTGQSGAASPWSEPAKFVTALLRPDDWSAQWIAVGPDRPPVPSTDDVRKRPDRPEPMPLFRREFSLAKPVKQALAYVSGLGQYELQINGQNVTPAVLNPGWTDYRKTVLYNSYDVTRWLQAGPNAIGVMLGNGMYNVPGVPGRYTKFIGSFGIPKLIFQMQIVYSDGSQSILASDDHWKTASGPIVFSSTYGGEDYDARQEQPGWSTPGFREENWKPATVVAGPGGVLRAQETVSITAGQQVYASLRISEPRPGTLVYDFGQNIAGWPRIIVRGSRGATIRLMAGELLDSHGLVTQHSANATPEDPNVFSYTLSGNGDESWAPRFSYYGFRYVQVEGAARSRDDSSRPVVLSLQAESVHDAATVVGEFTSSEVLLTQIHRLISHAMVNNMASVLTDCPHREKLGWLEQTHLAGASILFNYDVLSLYRKMADDMRDAQTSDGMVPSTAPEYVRFLDQHGGNTAFRDSPEFGSASILSPWTAYQFYGDRQILTDNYEVMKKFAGYLQSRARDHILFYGLGDWFDVGPKTPGESQLTTKAVTATAIYFQDVTTLANIATILGHEDDARFYLQEAQATRQAFNAAFFHSDTNEYDLGSQTANAMPLVVGLAPEDRRRAIVEHLVRDIRRHGNHVTAGDIGFHYVIRALSDAKRSDVVFDMLSRTDSPSYGFQLANGATSLTEAWDTNPNSSQDHFMLGHAEEWFYRGLAGLQFDLSKPPSEQITIDPETVGGILSASATYDSVQGRISSQWHRSGVTLAIDVLIPTGATATIYLPARDPFQITEGEKPLSAAAGIIAVENKGHVLRCTVGSGSYHFAVTAPKLE